MNSSEMHTFQLQDMDRSSKRRQSCCSWIGYLGTPGEERMRFYINKTLRENTSDQGCSLQLPSRGPMPGIWRERFTVGVAGQVAFQSDSGLQGSLSLVFLKSAEKARWTGDTLRCWPIGAGIGKEKFRISSLGWNGLPRIGISKHVEYLNWYLRLGWVVLGTVLWEVVDVTVE